MIRAYQYQRLTAGKLREDDDDEVGYWVWDAHWENVPRLQVPRKIRQLLKRELSGWLEFVEMNYGAWAYRYRLVAKEEEET